VENPKESNLSKQEQVTRTIPGMRLMLLVASILVLVVGMSLFFLPRRTDAYFAWTINPPITAAFLGSAYFASFLMELLGSREKLWARARITIPAVLVFTTLTLVVTLIHLDKFHFGAEFDLTTQVGTWGWMLVYALVPVAMAILLVQQLRVRGQDPPRRFPISAAMRGILALQALVMIGLGAALLIMPVQTGELFWPWQLSALTGRAIGAWLVGLGTGAAQMSYEGDWWRAELGALAAWVFGLLEIATLVRFATDTNAAGEDVLDWGDPRLWAYVIFLVSLLTVGLYGWITSRYRRKEIDN
jgi:hypothetical protein